VQGITLAFQTKFFPQMRGALTTTVALGSSAGTAIRLKVLGGATSRASLAGRAATASSLASTVMSRLPLAGLARTAFKAGGNVAGSTILAFQTKIFPAMRGALNAAVVPTSLALAATAAAISRARSGIAARAALEGGSKVSGGARGGLSAIAAVTGQAAAKAMGAASMARKTALAAGTVVKTATNGSMAGVAALFGRAASRVTARLSSAGTAILLIARATTAAKIVAGLAGRTPLAGKSALSVRTAAQPPRLAAFLAAVATVAARARASASAAADITAAARARIATSSRGTMSAVVGLAGRAQAAAAVRLTEPVLPLIGRAVVRASAKALLFVLAPVIPTPVNTRPGRLARLNASLLKAFGEDFDIVPMTPGVNVNGRSQADVSRVKKVDISGIWDGPTTSRTPHARGALQDDNAHNWNASYPSANFDDGLVAGVRKGDVLTRKLDGAVYEIVRVVPNGFGRTTLQLQKRKRVH
jgi:hypothetical protein